MQGCTPFCANSRSGCGWRNWVLLVVAVLLASGCGPDDSQVGKVSGVGETARSHLETSQAGSQQPKFIRSKKSIPGQYLVVLQEGVSSDAVQAVADDLAKAHGAVVLHVYRHAIKGFAVKLPEVRALALSEDPRVSWVEEDSEAEIVDTEMSPPWGLDRIHQRALPLDDLYVYGSTGTGVRAYVIDTGIRITHQEFQGRASIGYDTVGDGHNGDDCHGHGTHVAATIGGVTYGVAKNVPLYAVRVLDCGGSGSYSGVIAGIDWVTSNYLVPAVANMSLGGPPSATLDAAVQGSIAAGVTYAIAAGNDGTDACAKSPAEVPQAITVAATDSTDAIAYFSNQGPCVDICAPGVGITSAWNTSDTATNTISGTSMATPHIAGIAALYLEATPWASPADVAQALLANATSGALANVWPTTPNLLAYSGFITAGPADSNPPTVTLTAPHSGDVVTGPATLTAEASDDVGVAAVMFLVDGRSVGSVLSPPYVLTWESSQVENGPHTIVARAYDAKANQGNSAPVSVTTSNPVRLIVKIAGTGSGTVTGPGINCSSGSNSGCTTGVPEGTRVTLTATAAPGSNFAGWTGACIGQGTCDLVMDASKEVTANFGPTYHLSVTMIGNGGGTVAGSGLNCSSGSPTSCEAEIPAGSMVTLTATPDSVSRPAGWSGCDSVTATTCTLNMNAPKTVTMNWQPASFLLTVAFSGAGTGAVSGGPITNCSSSNRAGCSATVAANTAMTLTATPDAGSAFSGWSGPCYAISGNTCSVMMDAAKTVTASFQQARQPITVTTQGTVQGTVTASGTDPPIACNANTGVCSATAAYGSSVVLTGSKDATAIVVGWNGCDAVARDQTTCTVTMTAAKAITALFQPAYLLTIGFSGAGTGSVSGGPITSCSSSNRGGCSANVAANTAVTLTASPDASSAFSGWTGPCYAISGNTCSVMMDAAKTVTASFQTTRFSVTVTTQGTVQGTVTTSATEPPIACQANTGVCSGTAPYGSTVVLTGSKDATAVITGWSGCDAVAPDQTACTLDMTSGENVIAYFQPGAYLLTVSTAGAGQGSISGPNGLACSTPSSCSASVPSGSTVSIVAVPATGSIVAGWTGCASVTSDPTTGTSTCTVTVTSAMTVTTTFQPATVPLTVVFSGSGNGQVTGGGLTSCGGKSATCSVNEAYGALVTLTATPNPNSTFDSWSGCDWVAATQCTVTTTTARSVTVAFTKTVKR